MLIQYLLNLNNQTTGLTIELPVNGLIQREAFDAIKTFQRDVMMAKIPDGKISPGGPTFKKLAAADASSPTVLAALRAVMGVNASGAPLRAGEISSTVGTVDISTFINLYFAEFGHLGSNAMDGVTELLGFMNADQNVLDVAWAAYMLATVKHECADRWKPIEEFGKGNGHSYGNAVSVTDPTTGKVNSNKYFGRGYVQLTWEANYKSLGNSIGLGNDLWLNPSLALDPSVAYDIMSYGMRNGSFTNKKLSDYINRSGCDYQHSRRIINGMDQYQRIAGYAERLELILRAGCTGSFSSCF